MSILELATLYPGAEKLHGYDNVYKCHLRTKTKNLAVPSIIKIPQNETALAKEIFFGLLSREIGLPTPAIFLVRIESNIIPGITKDTYAFGIKESKFPSVYTRIKQSGDISPMLLKWPHLYNCAAFDSWAGITDRIPDNLLFNGKEEFIVIDFGEALPGYITKSYAGMNSLIRDVLNNSTEFHQHQSLRKLNKEALKFNDIDLKYIANQIFSSNRIIDASILKSICSLLESRKYHLPQIFQTQLGMTQHQLDFGNEQDQTNKSKI